ncbi:MAG TPA: dihydropteroate synthase, partial [Chitinophagaceae bacterium]|nr:dihydropteroate synthase [Chitinophagaceae bacterium]
MFTLNCKGKFLWTEKPLIMGILNINTDSFYEGSRFLQPAEALGEAQRMAEEGADIIDIGGQSTRPASGRIPAEEELDRVLPVVKLLTEKLNEKIILSIDTYHSGVAKACVEAGASMVNDISGGELDKEMICTVAALNVPYICMHMKGVPETMHIDIRYENVVTEVLDFFI